MTTQRQRCNLLSKKHHHLTFHVLLFCGSLHFFFSRIKSLGYRYHTTQQKAGSGFPTAVMLSQKSKTRNVDFGIRTAGIDPGDRQQPDPGGIIDRYFYAGEMNTSDTVIQYIHGHVASTVVLVPSNSCHNSPL